jgi:hypothetical protein
MKTFDEYKAIVSIIQVAEDLGYKLDKTKGMVQPSYKRFDANGNKIDEIIIKNPTNPSQQSYFDRNHKGGDLINFIKNNINEFPQFQHQNEFVKINMILGHYANAPYVPQNQSSVRKFVEKQDFNKARYSERQAEIKDLKYLTKERGLSEETVTAFLPNIKIVKDTKSEKGIPNIGFPYKVPGTGEVVNYELRNNGFKGMAAGGNKTDAVWLATTAQSPKEVKNLYFFESAIDAMSYYELQKGKVDLKNSAFVSVGGYVAKNQIANTIKQFPKALINTGYDNDINGRKYDIITYGVAIGKDLRLEKEGENIKFSWDGKQVSIKEKDVTLNAFKDVSGLKFAFGNVQKAPGRDDWNTALKIEKQQLGLFNSEKTSGTPVVKEKINFDGLKIKI